MGYPASTRFLYLIMERAGSQSLATTTALPGFDLLSPLQKEQFSHYVLFQLSFALYVMGQQGCAHEDLAKVVMDNIRYDLSPGDPCVTRQQRQHRRQGQWGNTDIHAECPWGFCWRIGELVWCFNRRDVPIGVIIKLIDFGTAHLCSDAKPFV
jgi:hypothetical protein